jgi:hypothetical protein
MRNLILLHHHYSPEPRDPDYRPARSVDDSSATPRLCNTNKPLPRLPVRTSISTLKSKKVLSAPPKPLRVRLDRVTQSVNRAVSKRSLISLVNELRSSSIIEDDDLERLSPLSLQPTFIGPDARSPDWEVPGVLAWLEDVIQAEIDGVRSPSPPKPRLQRGIVGPPTPYPFGSGLDGGGKVERVGAKAEERLSEVEEVEEVESPLTGIEETCHDESDASEKGDEEQERVPLLRPRPCFNANEFITPIDQIFPTSSPVTSNSALTPLPESSDRTAAILEATSNDTSPLPSTLYPLEQTLNNTHCFTPTSPAFPYLNVKVLSPDWQKFLGFAVKTALPWEPPSDLDRDDDADKGAERLGEEDTVRPTRSKEGKEWHPAPSAFTCPTGDGGGMMLRLLAKAVPDTCPRNHGRHAGDPYCPSSSPAFASPPPSPTGLWFARKLTLMPCWVMVELLTSEEDGAGQMDVEESRVVEMLDPTMGEVIMALMRYSRHLKALERVRDFVASSVRGSGY